MQACLSHEHLTLYGPNEASIAIREQALRLIVTRMAPALERLGVTRRQIRQMLVHNPRRHLGIFTGQSIHIETPAD